VGQETRALPVPLVVLPLVLYVAAACSRETSQGPYHQRTAFDTLMPKAIASITP
jgi:hypothetical protein